MTRQKIMKPDDFERQLQRQTPREIPGEWRHEIMDAAKRANNVPLSTRNPRRSPWWRELLWPCPQAWAGLAAVWLAILFLSAASREPVQISKTSNAAPAREQLMALQERRRLLAELMGSSVVAEPAKAFQPRPRSEILRRTVMG